ncbi:hypothetical protein H0N95_00020 [Candidatus Micrarchaeota archaeon]|nr:hypothetical protein [Candidatus Micrarchaeota archaeon]
MRSPAVKFVYSYPYDRTMSGLIGKEWSFKNEGMVRKQIKLIESAWAKLEGNVLKEMPRATGLKWKVKEIRCYVNSYGVPFSDPLTITILTKTGSKKTMDRIIDNLVHELIHVFLSTSGFKSSQLKKFKKESPLTRTHIFVHALHKHILLKFFGEERLRKTVDFSNKIKSEKPEYARVWEIVESKGFENIIKEIKV